MGSGFSRVLFPCINNQQNHQDSPDVIFTASEALDETLGHSFCYVRSSNRFLSPTPSARLSPSHSLRLSPSHDPPHPHPHLKTRPVFAETAFRSISGASVSANTYTPRSVLQHDHIYDDATDSRSTATANNNNNNNNNSSSLIFSGFESTSSFSALPLQPVPRGDAALPGAGGGFFMSGPIERGALSGPLDANSAGMDAGQVHFSAPLNGIYVKRRRKKGLSGIRKAFYRNLSEKKRPWVVPVLNFGRKDGPGPGPGSGSGQNTVSNLGHGGEEGRNASNVQWAHGKAGEDRVHVVVSEEQGWLFVGIYDGFNGPDAPEFLMSNLYRAVFNELKGLFWEAEEANLENLGNLDNLDVVGQEGSERIQENVELVEGIDAMVKNCGGEGGGSGGGQVVEIDECLNQPGLNCGSVKRVTFQEEEEKKKEVRRGKPLWEFLAEDGTDDGFDLSGSDRFAFSVDDALNVSDNAGSVVKRGSLLMSKLKYGFSKHKEGGQGHSRRFLPWRYNWEEKEKTEIENRVVDTSSLSCKKRLIGPVDPELVLRSLSRALEITELAYLEMTDKVLDVNPELALMGSCLLVVLMRDEDVYVMNVGDSRAIVAQYQPETGNSNVKNGRFGGEGIVEEPNAVGEELKVPVVTETPAQMMRLAPLQLSTDHSTSIEEEVLRIKQEHPDDSQCIVNDRVKGRLKVTRAFGAGFLKQPKLNNALLEMFRNEYIGNAPYISCSPSLRHHKLGRNDQFLILSSDGLYQYLSNEEVVSHVENFMEKFPDGDPAQHLIEELLFRAAKKAGMDFHELLDIPQGDRRKYHDDVTVMVISLEGRIWKSSGKYL